MGRPSGPMGALRAGFWYMFCISSVGLIVGRLWMREQRSPWRQALQEISSNEDQADIRMA